MLTTDFTSAQWNLEKNKITPSKTQVKFQLLLRSMYLLAGRKAKTIELRFCCKYMAKLE